MPTFDYEFTVDAPQSAVADFHYNASVKTLTPLPIIAQMHEFEPLADGSQADFTLWFGPLPINWKVVHSDVGPDGFTDSQISGPLKSWRHEHRFIPIDENSSKVHEHIEYEYKSGLKGLLSRLLFSPLALRMLFMMRERITRRAVSGQWTVVSNQ